jgi:hypothetical protein
MFFPDRFKTPLSIAYAFVATHNHFVLDRGGKVFKQTAPVIKLDAAATLDDHLALLGVLNASLACFWMRQVAFPRGGTGEAWALRFNYNGTQLEQFPLPPAYERVVPLARRLDELASQRRDADVASVLADAGWQTAATLRERLAARRAADDLALRLMVALQEELDWLVYGLYGLDPAPDAVEPEAVTPVEPTALPWNVAFARHDRTVRAAIEQGEDPGDLPTAWFERHGWTPRPEGFEGLPPATRARYEARLERTRAVPELALVETATFKRRWENPDHAADEHEALEAWLADRIEAVARERGRPFTLEQLVASVQDDPRVLAVAEVFAGRRDVHLGNLVAGLVHAEAVPHHPYHVYRPSGLLKRAAWERTWDEQRREDAGEPVVPAVPPAYDAKDFLNPGFWPLRGKLDVPRERFIAYTEVPGATGDEALFGWAGWTPLQRLRVLLGLDEALDDRGVPLADRVALLDGAWRLLPDAAREDAAATRRLQAELQALLGSAAGPSPEQLAAWQDRFPPPKPPRTRQPRPARRRALDDQETDAP